MSERLISLPEIKEILKEEGIPPSKLYDVGELMRDEAIKAEISRQADLEVNWRKLQAEKEDRPALAEENRQFAPCHIRDPPAKIDRERAGRSRPLRSV